MPIRVTVLVKRKPGLSPEEFRHMYETGHAKLALRLFGHLWTGYRRGYLSDSKSFAGGADAAMGGSSPYDAVSEFMVPDMAAIEEMGRIASDPETLRLITEDEERTFDRPNCWMSLTDLIEEELPAAAAAAGNTKVRVPA